MGYEQRYIGSARWCQRHRVIVGCVHLGTIVAILLGIFAPWPEEWNGRMERLVVSAFCIYWILWFLHLTAMKVADVRQAEPEFQEAEADAGEPGAAWPDRWQD